MIYSHALSHGQAITAGQQKQKLPMKHYRINTEEKQSDGSYKLVNDRLVLAANYKRAVEKVKSEIPAAKRAVTVVSWNGES